MSAESDFKDLQEKANTKLHAAGYCGSVLINYIKRPFMNPDPLKSYGIAYGAILAPLSIEEYLDEAYKEKEKLEFIKWLNNHGGRVTFSIFDTKERSTTRWVKKYQFLTRKIGNLCSDKMGWLVLAIMINPEVDPFLTREKFPDVFEFLEDILNAYLADEVGIE